MGRITSGRLRIEALPFFTPMHLPNCTILSAPLRKTRQAIEERVFTTQWLYSVGATGLY